MIERGPRFEAVREAVRFAISSFDDPLDDVARMAGWTDEDRLAALGELEALDERLGTDPAASLAAFELPTESGDDPLCDAVDAVDFLADDLALASAAADDAVAFVEWLESDEELEASVRADLVRAACGLRDALEGGEYLGDELVATWLDALERHGCRRQAHDPTPQDAGRGSRIVSWPKGKAWDEIVVFDHRLAPVFGRDRLALQEGEETEAD